MTAAISKAITTPKTAKKERIKSELIKAKEKFMNSPVKEPVKFPDNHKWGRNDCDCEKCMTFRMNKGD